METTGADIKSAPAALLYIQNPCSAVNTGSEKSDAVKKIN